MQLTSETPEQPLQSTNKCQHSLSLALPFIQHPENDSIITTDDKSGPELC